MMTVEAATRNDLMRGGYRMVRRGFKMFLGPGVVEEYEKRHNTLWPEMKGMIRQYGGHNYSIFLDRGTNVLYRYLEVEDETLWARSVGTPINHRWWDYMAGIVETNADNSPVCMDFVPVLRLD